MYPSIDSLPVEIHERILSDLTGDSLVSASKVCELWHEIAIRIVKMRYEKAIPTECVDEVRKQSKCNDEDVWLQVLNCHNQQQLLINKSMSYKMPLYSIEIDTYSREMCFDPFGSSCFVSDGNQLYLYDAEFGSQLLASVTCEGYIRQLIAMQNINILLVLSDTLEVFELPDLSCKTCDMKKLKVTFKNQTTKMKTCRISSADDCYIVMQFENNEIIAYRIEKNDDEVSLVFMNDLKAPSKIYNFSLWNHEVFALLETGHILQWIITSADYSQCGMYQEIRYKNPVWIYRGRIFCSTLTSRVLLGLWHLEIGTFYWLMGKPKAKLLRCFNLDPLIGHVVEEVCSICLKQRLLCCGTNGGKVIIYYLSEVFFSDDDLYTETLNAEFDREPDLIINVCEGPIEDVKVEFTDNYIYIVVRAVKVQRTVANLQCIALSGIKGHNKSDITEQ